MMNRRFWKNCKDEVIASIPDSWIPVNWSDFDFWQSKITSLIELVRDVLFTQRGLFEISYYNQLLRSILYMAGAMVLFILSIWKLKVKKLADLGTM